MWVAKLDSKKEKENNGGAVELCCARVLGNLNGALGKRKRESKSKSKKKRKETLTTPARALVIRTHTHIKE